MHPFVLLLLVLIFCIEVRARPWNLLVGSARENELKKLKRADMKCGDGTGEVEPPGSHEIRVEHFGYFLTGLFKSRQPVLQCFCIMRPQVFDIQDGQIPRFENLHGLAQRGSVGTLKDALSGPRAEGTRMIAPNKMKQSAPGFG